MNARDSGIAPSHARGVARRWTYGILVLTLLFVLMPFLFWQATWFGRPLSDREMEKNLNDLDHPRNAQHALSQIADRIVRGDPTVKRWYPQLVSLASNPVNEIRLTAAWVMGQDNTVPEFHQALLRLLADAQPMVRQNAALALVRFGDATGRPEIVGMLRPYALAAPQGGTLLQRLKAGDTVNPGTLVARIEAGAQKVEVRSSVPGMVAQWATADRSAVSARQTMAWIAPSPQMVWEALRALYLVGQREDLSAVEPYARGVVGMPPQVQQQADLTLRQIRSRSGSR